MKSYTTIEQSRKLAKIISPTTADAFYRVRSWNNNTCVIIQRDNIIFPDVYDIPCWSLVALLNVIPKRIKDYNVLRIDISENEFAIWYDEIGYGVNNDLPNITMESAVDACVAMIEKLHELKKL